MRELAMRMQFDRPFAGPQAIIERFDKDKAVTHRAAWLTVKIAAGDGVLRRGRSRGMSW